MALFVPRVIRKRSEPMKTLDEVIAEMEDEGVFPDALYHLKMYRSDKLQYDADRREWYETWQEKLKKLEESRQRFIDKLKELDIGTLNDPLSWDELRTMEGKPVWMEDDTGTKFYRGWAIVLDFKFANGNYLHYEGDNYAETCVDVENIGKTWNAYRKERK